MSDAGPTAETVMVDYIGFLKQESARKDVLLEQLQNINAQLIGLLVGTPGPGLPSAQEDVVPDPGGDEEPEEPDHAMHGGDIDIASLFERH